MSISDTLSVVVITRNEEKNIDRCLSSIFEKVREFNIEEVIVVDSASTDKTIEIVKKYPCKIIKLDPTLPLSPSAGCYVGNHFARGEYVFFIGGDMVLNSGWFQEAMQFMRRKEYGALGGSLIQISEGSEITEAIKKKIKKAEKKFGYGVKCVKTVGGAMLIKKKVLDEVGSFTPYLMRLMEGDLCHKIVYSGYKIVYLPYPLVTHYGRIDIKPEELFQHKKADAFATGQILKKSLRERNFRIFLWRIATLKNEFIMALLLLISICSLTLYFPIRSLNLFFLPLIGLLLFFIFLYSKIRNFKKTLKRFFGINYRLLYIIKGFLVKSYKPKMYLENIKILNECKGSH